MGFDIRRIARPGILAAMLGTFVVAPAASAQDATPFPYQPPDNIEELSGTVATDGSSTVGPLTQAVAEEFAAVAPGVTVPVDISGTGGGFERFCQGQTDVQNASRAISPEEIAACAEAGVEWYEFVVANDGITIVVSAENDFVNCLTVEQLNQLWMPESQVDTWSDLNPEWPDEEITLYGPGPDSGTFDYFTETINGDEGASRTDYQPSEDDNVIVQGVAGDEYALGYFGYAYYVENQDSLKAVEIDNGSGCVAPTEETIANGSYAPLSRPLYIYVAAASLERPEVAEFIRFYMANSGALASSVGYIALPAEHQLEQQVKAEGAISGEVAPDSQTAGTPEATPGS